MSRKVTSQSLPNGLQVILEENPGASSAAIGFYVRTGSRDEQGPESGVSHFLEHMMFKGTETRTAFDINTQLSDYGAQANAFTSEEMTVYYASVIPEYLPQIQELLSDMLRSTLDPKEFDMEKKVILEEIAMYQDRPIHVLAESAQREYFGDHPCGNSVLGSTESITDLTRDQMYSYFQRRYAPGNITLVISGNINGEECWERAEEYCSAWKAFDVDRTISRHSDTAITKTYYRENLNQAHVLFITSSASAQDEERYPLAVLSNILGDSSGSKLYWELVDKGIAESVFADAEERDGTGVFLGYACTLPEKLDEVASTVRRIIQNPLDFTNEDLERAKAKLLTRVVLNGELPIGRIMSIGNSWTYNKEIISLEEIISKLQAVNRESIEAALERYPMTQLSEFRLMPK